MALSAGRSWVSSTQSVRGWMLTRMSLDLIKAVQLAALEDERAAWAIMEKEAKEWLERRRGSEAPEVFSFHPCD